MAEFAIALAAIGTVAQMGETVSAADAAKQSLTMQHNQKTLAIEQDRQQTIGKIRDVTAAQEAQATVRGFDFSSPSFNAIQRDTYNKGGTDLKNLTTQGSIMDASYKIEKENINKTMWAKLFGQAASGGSSIAMLQGLKPAKPPVPGASAPKSFAKYP